MRGFEKDIADAREGTRRMGWSKEENERKAEEERIANQVTCKTCGQTGGRYFFGHDSPHAPHPWYASTGSEGRCDLCGGMADTYLHEQHDKLSRNPVRRVLYKRRKS